MVIARRAPQIWAPLIPFCSRFDSVLFTPKMQAIAGRFNFFEASINQTLSLFIGAGRRRNWPAEQKARIGAERYASGETVCAVARRHGLTSQQLFGWRRDARSQSENEAGKGGIEFMPVIVSGPRADMLIAPACLGGPPSIEIVIGAAPVLAAS
jgi:hypothetical protein